MDFLQTTQMTNLLKRIKSNVKAYHGSYVSVEGKTIDQLLSYCNPVDRKDFKEELESLKNPRK